MTCKESIKWLENLKSDLGKSQFSELWHYEQVLAETIELLQSKRLVELPCSVGNKYYKLKAKCTKMRDCYVYECGVCLTNCDKQVYIEECTYKNAWEILNVYKKEQEEIKICKSMRCTFTNKEEAEAKLGELNNDQL